MFIDKDFRRGGSINSIIHYFYNKYFNHITSHQSVQSFVNLFIDSYITLHVCRMIDYVGNSSI